MLKDQRSNQAKSDYHLVPHVHRCPNLQFGGGPRFLHKTHEWTCWRPKCKDPLDNYACGLIADRAGLAIQETISTGKYFSLIECAQMAGYSPRQMARIAKKELDPFINGTRYFILKTKFDEWLTKRGIHEESQSA